MKITYWERDPVSYKKHKRSVVGKILKDGAHDFVIQVGEKEAIVIPHHNIIRIQEELMLVKIFNKRK